MAPVSYPDPGRRAILPSLRASDRLPEPGDLRDRTSLNCADDRILGERDPRHVLKLADGIVAAKEEDLEDDDENQDKSVSAGMWKRRDGHAEQPVPSNRSLDGSGPGYMASPGLRPGCVRGGWSRGGMRNCREFMPRIDHWSGDLRHTRSDWTI